MTFLVQNCFHWIGYHYVNFLLEEGMVVKGVDKIDSDKKDNLHMHIGRNSLFELTESQMPNKVDVAIVIGEVDSASIVNAERIIQLNVNGLKNRLENATIIKAPILFGEWMDMTEGGVMIGGKEILFDSEEFRTEAVYIGDFIKATFPILKSPTYSTNIHVLSKKIFLNDSVKLDNSLYIRDNIPIEENIKKVMAHYRRYKNFY